MLLKVSSSLISHSELLISLSLFVEAVEVQKSREKAVTKKTTAHKMLMSLKEHTRKDLEIKFRNEKRLCESLRETETEVTVVDENEVAQGK
jgi:hypothetical protein